MVRTLGLVALLAASLLGDPAQSQTARVLEPGARVRATVPSDVLPPNGGTFVGTLVGVGDTLSIRTEGGSTIRLTTEMLTGLDVSEGPPRFPYWIPAVGTGVGLAVGIPLGMQVKNKGTCPSPRECPYLDYTSKWQLKRGILVGGSTVAGFLLGTVVARAQSQESWRPERRMRVAASPGALSLHVAL